MLDPSDLSTMFQDDAGTVPVTAVEQPVGKILDVSGNGNHFVQATLAKRPKLSARVNMYTSGFASSSAVHPVGDSKQVVTLNAALTADGVMRATKSAPNTENTRHSGYVTAAINAPLKISVYAKPAGLNYIEFSELGSNLFGICFNLVGSGSVSGVSGLCSLGNSKITALNDGWYFCETTLTGSVNNAAVGVSAVPSGTPGAWGQIFTGDGINGAYFYDFSIVNAIDAHLPYQHVAAYGISYDADPAKFPYYLSFDGTNAAMASAAVVPMSGSDKVMVGLGVTKLSDAFVALAIESSPVKNSNSGSFGVVIPGISGQPSYDWAPRGTTEALTTVLSRAAPDTAALLGISDISAPISSLYVDGALGGTKSSTQGTGSFLDYAHYLGARNQTTYLFSGRIHGILTRGGASTPEEQALVTAWLASKQKRTL